MGLKGSGPYFQRSMASVVLAGLVYIICEIYIDDVLKVLDFPLPDTHRGLLMFIGFANYFRDQVSNITEMLKPLRDMILVAKGANLSKKLIWTEERIAAFKECQMAVSNSILTR